jgi:hypothetical protein
MKGTAMKIKFLFFPLILLNAHQLFPAAGKKPSADTFLEKIRERKKQYGAPDQPEPEIKAPEQGQGLRAWINSFATPDEKKKYEQMRKAHKNHRNDVREKYGIKGIEK